MWKCSEVLKVYCRLELGETALQVNLFPMGASRCLKTGLRSVSCMAHKPRVHSPSIGTIADLHG